MFRDTEPAETRPAGPIHVWLGCAVALVVKLGVLGGLTVVVAFVLLPEMLMIAAANGVMEARVAFDASSRDDEQAKAGIQRLGVSDGKQGLKEPQVKTTYHIMLVPLVTVIKR